MDSHLKLTADKEDVLPSPTPYQRLLGRLIYLTVTGPDISFLVQLLSHFMQQPTSVHMQLLKGYSDTSLAHMLKAFSLLPPLLPLLLPTVTVTGQVVQLFEHLLLVFAFS